MSYNLKDMVSAYSVSDDWTSARLEWDVVQVKDFGADRKYWRRCVCGKEGIRYGFTLKNRLNGQQIFPIGSDCVRKFGNKDMTKQMKGLTSLANFRTAVREMLKSMETMPAMSLDEQWFKSRDVLDVLLRGKYLTARSYVFLCEISRRRVLTHNEYLYRDRVISNVSSALKQKYQQTLTGGTAR